MEILNHCTGKPNAGCHHFKGLFQRQQDHDPVYPFPTVPASPPQGEVIGRVIPWQLGLVVSPLSLCRIDLIRRWASNPHLGGMLRALH